MWPQAFAMCFLYVPIPPPAVIETDLNLFPSKYVADQAVKMANCHITWLEERLIMCRVDQIWFYREWLIEAQARREAWSNLLSAHGSGEAMVSVRYSLECLRGQIGHNRYYNGRLPHPLPVWRFCQP